MNRLIKVYDCSEESLAKCGPSYCPQQLIKSNNTEDETVNENFEAAADLSNTYKIAGRDLYVIFKNRIWIVNISKQGERFYLLSNVK